MRPRTCSSNGRCIPASNPVRVVTVSANPDLMPAQQDLHYCTAPQASNHHCQTNLSEMLPDCQAVFVGMRGSVELGELGQALPAVPVRLPLPCLGCTIHSFTMHSVIRSFHFIRSLIHPFHSIAFTPLILPSLIHFISFHSFIHPVPSIHPSFMSFRFISFHVFMH